MTVPYPTRYHVPEVLVETANMRSPTGAALLDDPGFCQGGGGPGRRRQRVPCRDIG
jgi:hypothetical protein